LIATLMNTSTSQPISGQTVTFTLDGTPVGSAMTDSNGVATLPDVATTDGAGTYPGVVVASYAGDANYMAATDATGDFVVSQAATSLGSVSGTATYGGTATLVATLTGPNGPISGQSVTFTLDGVSVGSTQTDSNGIATLTGVATIDTAGTHTGAVVASYTGDTNYTAATDATGDLVVSQASTSLGTVSGAETVGGSATLTATLTDTSNGQPISGQTVDFTLDGNSFGSALTDSNGVATLTGVGTSDPAETYPNAVIASYTGDTNYSASADASGDFVVSPVKISTILVAVSATAPVGGPATLTAKLEDQSTGDPIVGETISFMLQGVDVGSMVTDSNGVATLTGIETSASSGTYPNGITATFAGDSTYLTAQGSGDFTVGTPT
jgi:hypothetical protein